MAKRRNLGWERRDIFLTKQGEEGASLAEYKVELKTKIVHGEIKVTTDELYDRLAEHDWHQPRRAPKYARGELVFDFILTDGRHKKYYENDTLTRERNGDDKVKVVNATGQDIVEENDRVDRYARGAAREAADGREVEEQLRRLNGGNMTIQLVELSEKHFQEKQKKSRRKAKQSDGAHNLQLTCSRPEGLRVKVQPLSCAN